MPLITIGELTLELQHKGIKNLHINVLPLMVACASRPRRRCHRRPSEWPWSDACRGSGSNRPTFRRSHVRASARCAAARRTTFGDGAIDWR